MISVGLTVLAASWITILVCFILSFFFCKHNNLVLKYCNKIVIIAFCVGFVGTVILLVGFAAALITTLFF